MQRNVAAGRVPADAVTVAGFTGRAQSLRDIQVGSLREMVVVLQAIVIVVLLIACANLANLQLTRVTSRRKELAVRAALGAGGERLVRMVLVEALLLALAGGALGVAVAVGGLALVRALGLDRSSDGFAFVLDTTALVYTLGCRGARGRRVGFAARARAAARGFDGRDSRGRPTKRRWPPRSAVAQRLVVAQLAMSVMLLVGAGLLTKSFYGLLSEGPGFNSGSVWTAQFSLAGPRYAQRESWPRFESEAVAALRALPGVERGRFHVDPAVRQRQRLRVGGHRRLRAAAGRSAAARSAPLDRRSLSRGSRYSGDRGPQLRRARVGARRDHRREPCGEVLAGPQLRSVNGYATRWIRMILGHDHRSRARRQAREPRRHGREGDDLLALRATSRPGGAFALRTVVPPAQLAGAVTRGDRRARSRRCAVRRAVHGRARVELRWARSARRWC